MNKLLFTIACGLFNNIANAQGCIMVRNVTGFGQYNTLNNTFSTSEWQLSVTNRYFKSWRDFKGKKDQKTPKEDQSVIRSFTTDMTLTKYFRHAWSMNLSIPIAANSRSTTKEHGGAGTARHETHSFGLGDVRLTAYKWLFKPYMAQKGNIQLGLGFKFPTGNYKYEDYYYPTDSTRVLAPVNASIQLGDGGTGIIAELNTYFLFNKTISAYGNFFYLSNPRDVNGVSATGWKPPTPTQKASGGDVYSVPDVYSARAGMNIDIKSFIASAGMRIDGVPYSDVLGDNNGVRRPGYNLSFEPGVVYKMQKSSVYVYVPIIADRKVSQDPSDAKASELLHEYKASPGGSGNFYVFFGVLFRL